MGELETYERLLEVGIGRRTAIAEALLETGCAVVATDVHLRETPEGVRFVIDDVTDPDLETYADADAIYALNLPPELHRPVLEVARAVDADLLFTTLGGDPPLVPVERVSLPRETLFVSRRGKHRPGDSH
ncbi:UPF0146 family protein [Natronosalvus rutilus]|uniref:UPF0146 protein NGM29_03740 n=1 Tax=Natronosalvus rutilus TaxID=2953753 RepID=A0A9E7NEC0_9EURY|nr:UPF0146 family protein [Natronosalvus rutilus]UTF55414.1 UPF0146 family protein [Natronosalvus rutilus]